MSTERLPGENCYRGAVYNLEKYIAGYTTEQVRRELGLTDLVKLASNENAWGPSPQALAAIEGELHNLWQYPEQSFFDLKHVLAEHNGVRPENVVVGHGTEVIIQLLPQLFCESGDDVIVAYLTYGRYAEAAKLMDARVQVVPLRDFHYDLEAVRAAIGPRTKLVWLCSPNNPTGCILRRTELDAFMASLPEGVAVVFDQAYREFVDDPDYADGLDLLKEGRENVIVLRTFSKAYGLAGMRLGYALVPERVCWLLDTIKEPFNLNRLSIVAGPAALRDAEWLQDCVAQTIAGRTLLTETLTGWGFDVAPSQANFVLADMGENAEELWDRLLRRGVIVRPCTGWGLPQHMRVTVGRPEQNERFLEALRAESHALAKRQAGQAPAGAGAPA
jgi:histidinol-phosphate aminotransferase